MGPGYRRFAREEADDRLDGALDRCRFRDGLAADHVGADRDDLALALQIGLLAVLGSLVFVRPGITENELAARRVLPLVRGEPHAVAPFEELAVGIDLVGAAGLLVVGPIALVDEVVHLAVGVRDDHGVTRADRLHGEHAPREEERHDECQQTDDCSQGAAHDGPPTACCPNRHDGTSSGLSQVL